MSELLNNINKRRKLLKHMIQQINNGTGPKEIRTQLVRLLGQAPYADVLAVEPDLLWLHAVPVYMQFCLLHMA